MAKARTNSFLSPKCVVKKSRLHGLGVFAGKNISEGEVIAIWGGSIYSYTEIKKLGKKHPKMFTHPVEVHQRFFLGPSNADHLDPTDRFNHSCEPNAGIKGQIILVARRKIKIGEEICYDYETTDIAGLKLQCKCGAKNCRKVINGNSWKNKDFQKKNKDFFSYYIEEKIQKLSK